MAWIEESWSPAAATAARLALAGAAFGGLGGLNACTVFVPRDSPLPRDGATMEQIYQQHNDGTGEAGAASSASRSPRDRLVARSLIEDDEVVAQRRRLSEPLDNHFERMPNPDLVMHVYPHLARGRYPVPGYDTVFPMYEGVTYALPGEVAPRRQRSGSFTARAPDTGRLARPAGTAGDKGGK